jgi:hypothetical protein
MLLQLLNQPLEKLKKSLKKKWVGKINVYYGSLGNGFA